MMMMTLGTKPPAPQQIPICGFDCDSGQIVNEFANWLGSKNSVLFVTCEAKADEHFAAAEKQGLLPCREGSAYYPDEFRIRAVSLESNFYFLICFKFF